MIARRVRGARMLVLMLPLMATPAAAQTAPPDTAAGITLAEVLAVARAGSPRLLAARALGDARGAREASAGLPPDPVLQLGVMNVSVPGLDADMPASMAPSIQAMQMVPWPGKLSLSRRIAEQSTSLARSEADETWWQVRSDVAMAFYDIYEADRRLAVMAETLRLLEDFERVAKAMYAAGEGRQSDVLRAGVEVARMVGEIRRMRTMRLAAAARLDARLGLPADVPVPTPELPALPGVLPPVDTLRAWAEATRPMLARGRTEVEQAAARGSLARREIWPDLTIGLQYGQRPASAGMGGTERMASFMVGFSVPVFAAQRQLRMRDEAAAMERMAHANLSAMRVDVDARIAELVAQLEEARTLVRLYERDVLPQARAGVSSALSSYRIGGVDFMTLVDARMTVNEYESELHALVAAYGRGVAELEMTIGRELPPAAALLSEER